MMETVKDLRKNMMRCNIYVSKHWQWAHELESNIVFTVIEVMKESCILQKLI